SAPNSRARQRMKAGLSLRSKCCHPARARFNRAIASAQLSAARARSGSWSTRTTELGEKEGRAECDFASCLLRAADIVRIYAIRERAKAPRLSRAVVVSIPRPARLRGASGACVQGGQR